MTPDERLDDPCQVGTAGRSGTLRGGLSATIMLVLASMVLTASAIPALARAASRKAAAAHAEGKLPFIRLYTGPDGISHFDAEELTLAHVPGGQGLEALAVKRIGDVKGVTFAQLKAGATETWHVAPQRILMLCVRGIAEITAGDGHKRRLRPGQLMLLEDLTGKGHITHAVGPEDHVALAIPVPDGVLARASAVPAVAGSR